MKVGWLNETNQVHETNHETLRAHPENRMGPWCFYSTNMLDAAHEMRHIVLIDNSTHD